jgi:ubiquinone/menaquinone biosynthesis C-methylase UbiE
MTTVFTRSAAFYDVVYAWKDYSQEAAKLDALIQSKISEPRTLLDVACGTGKHLELLRDRYEVQGLDLDPQLLQIAKERLPASRSISQTCGSSTSASDSMS